MAPTAQQYHLHIYFEDHTETEARALYRLAQDRPDIDAIGRFHPAPIGPHPVRQFQLLVRAELLESVEKWLANARGELDVLIHPDIDDDLLAHTELARWLGSAHPLKLERFLPKDEQLVNA